MVFWHRIPLRRLAFSTTVLAALCAASSAQAMHAGTGGSVERSAGANPDDQLAANAVPDAVTDAITDAVTDAADEASTAESDTPATPSMFTFGGFGTLSAVHANTRQADFTSTSLRANGAGYTRRWSPTVDSRLGAQLGATFNKQWSGVLQVTSQQLLDGSYRPHVEWLNLKYQITPDLAVRLGRITLPMFLAADYRKVGYAYALVRPPLEVYNSIPISSSDGVEVSYRWRSGAVKHRTQLTYGHNEMRLTDAYRSKARALAALTYSAETGALTVRASAITARLSLNIGDELFDAIRQFGPAGDALANRYAVHDKRATGLTIGASYDPGQWFVMGEMCQMDGRSYLAKTHSAYAAAGYRHGKFTPYVAVAGIAANDPTRVDGLPVSGLPPRAAATAMLLNAGLNAVLTTIPIQSTISAGVRWDAFADVSFKLQFDRVLPKDGSRGTLINQQPGFRSDVPVNVTSVALDFVF